MANRSYLKSQKLKAAIDASQLLEDMERRLLKEQDENMESRNKLFKLQQESTQQIWLLKKDVENLERDKKELEEKTQSLQIRIEEIMKNSWR